MTRTATAHVAPITASASITVELETLRDVLRGVDTGELTPEEAEERLLAGVA